MSTVSNQPVPPKIVAPQSNVTSGAGAEGYARPTAGGNATGNNTPATSAVVPSADVYSPNLAGNKSA